MKIRRASRHDLEAIASVHAKSWQDAYRNLLPGDYLRDRVSHDLADHWKGVEIGSDDVVLVAEKGEIIGFIAVWCRPDPFIDNLHVLPTWRSKGIGRKLMAAAGGDLIRKGHSTAYLWVLRDNQGALKLYERLGGVAKEHADKEVFGHSVQSVKVVWSDISAMVR